MRKPKLKVVRRPGCRGWYIRPTVFGKSTWVFLSESKADAERMAVDYDHQRLLRKAEGYNPQASFNVAVSRYLKEKFATTLTTRKSQQRYSVVIKKFESFIDKYQAQYVTDVSKDMILDYLNHRDKVIKGKTWNFEREVINNFFIYCIHNDWLLKNPVTKIPPKKLPPAQVEHFSADEAKRFLEFLKGRPSRGIPYYEFFSTLLYTGMRVNEAIHLTKSDVLLEKNLLMVREKVIDGKVWRPKTKTNRFVPIPEVIRGIIKERIKTKGDLLFTNSKGKMMSDRIILAKIKSTCQRAKLKLVHTHSLRHTFTSVTSELGYPEVHIQEVLGHKSADMTRRYRHLRPEFLGEQFKGFDYRQKKEPMV